jgi:hypothetical protein
VKKPEKFILGDTEMLTEATKRSLGILTLMVFTFVALLFMLHLYFKEYSRLEINMLKDISRIRRNLKETELEEKTVRTIIDAFEDFQRDTHNYVNHQFTMQFILLALLGAVMSATFSGNFHRVNNKKPMT